MKQVAFEQNAFNDFTNWATQDKKIHAKIITLIKDIGRSPFVGLGKLVPPLLRWNAYGTLRIPKK